MEKEMDAYRQIVNIQGQQHQNQHVNIATTPLFKNRKSNLQSFNAVLTAEREFCTRAEEQVRVFEEDVTAIKVLLKPAPPEISPPTSPDTAVVKENDEEAGAQEEATKVVEVEVAAENQMKGVEVEIAASLETNLSTSPDLKKREAEAPPVDEEPSLKK